MNAPLEYIIKKIFSSQLFYSVPKGSKKQCIQNCIFEWPANRLPRSLNMPKANQDLWLFRVSILTNGEFTMKLPSRHALAGNLWVRRRRLTSAGWPSQNALFACGYGQPEQCWPTSVKPALACAKPALYPQVQNPAHM